MNLIYSLVLGIVEGVTEFLPISSTAHLILTSKIMNMPQTDFMKFFEVFIQSGAILAVVVIYFNYAIKNFEVMKRVALSFIPTAVVGFLLHKIIKEVFFESEALIVGAMLVVGLVFIVIEYLVKKKRLKLSRSLGGMSYLDSIVVGLGQALAVVPGVSRAGIVMVFMMLKGYRRDESALYSFLLAVPTILAASGYDLIKTNPAVITDTGNLPFLVTGFVTSFLTAYFSVKWLIGYLKEKTLIGFGIYRVILSLTLIVV